MKRTLSAVEARHKFGEVLEGVHYRGDEVVIARAGKPMAVLIPARLYESIKARREQMWEFIEKAQENNKDIPAEVLQKEIDEAIREVRDERRTRPVK